MSARLTILVLALAGLGAAAAAHPPAQLENAPYDGRFTFVRLRFATSMDLSSFRVGREPWWAHDYPRAERNLMQILEAITELRPYMGGGNVLAADDPELFKYPVAYICEVGYWNPTDAEVEGLRNYLKKGGFLIVDDFRGGHLYNFVHQIQRVLPGAELVELDASHPIFHSFFDIDSLELRDMNYWRYEPVWFGIFEDNDPQKRLLAVINYNNDLGEYWEFSDAGFLPVDLSNEAYKFGVNYIIYAMTH
jgi:hypothetical protein